MTSTLASQYGKGASSLLANKSLLLTARGTKSTVDTKPKELLKPKELQQDKKVLEQPKETLKPKIKSTVAEQVTVSAAAVAATAAATAEKKPETKTDDDAAMDEDAGAAAAPDYGHVFGDAARLDEVGQDVQIDAVAEARKEAEEKRRKIKKDKVANLKWLWNFNLKLYVNLFSRNVC